MWTKYQIQEVIDWMNTWEQLNGTAIPMRFKEDFMEKYKSDIELVDKYLEVKRHLGKTVNKIKRTL